METTTISTRNITIDGFCFAEENVSMQNKFDMSYHDGDSDGFMTWQRDGSVRLRLKDQGPGAEKPITVIEGLKQTVDRVPERVAVGKTIITAVQSRLDLL
jgi:hypothetical protein